jgi:hypothetical protein
MASIDDAIKTLIKELQKVSGEATGSGTGRINIESRSGEEIAKAKEIERLTIKLNDAYDDLLSKDSERLKKQDAHLKQKRRELEEAKNAKILDKDKILNLENQVRLAQEFRNQIREADEAAEGLADSFSNIFGGADAFKLEDALNPKNFIEVGKSMLLVADAADRMKAMDQIADKAVSAFTDSIVKQTFAVADMKVEFMKTTGASAEFAASLTTQYEEAREFGATTADVIASNQTLYSTFTDFTLISESARSSLALQGAELAKLGVSNQDFATAIQTSTKAMGMSTEQAGENMKDLTKFASDLGVAPSELASQFAGAGDMLAKLGSEGTTAFKNLAIAAKTTGMSIESIVNLTNKFDTFDGAADQAGKLNAALGGNFVNAMDLMMATDPAERFGMIRDSILDTGLSFDEMSYYQKNFFKDSLGLKDVGELAALMSGDMDLVSGAVNQNSDELLDAKKRAQELANMQDRLNMVLQSAIPIIEPLIDFVEGFTEALTNNIETTKIVIGALGSLALVYKIGRSVMMLQMFLAKRRLLLQGQSIAQTITQTTVETTKNTVDATGNTIKSTTVSLTKKQNLANKQAGGIAAASAKQMLAFGAAILMVGAGIGLAALGVAELVKSFKGLGDAAPYAVAGITIFSVAFGLMIAMLISLVAGPQAAVTAAAVGVLLSVGGAILMMGAAIAVAAVGFSYLIDSLGNLGEVSTSLLMLPVILYGIAASMAVFANPLTLSGIAMAIPLFLAMGAAAAMMGNDTAEAFAKVTEAITAIPTKKNLEFQTSMKTAALAMTTAAVAGVVFGANNQTTAPPVAQNANQKPYVVNINLELDGKQLDQRTVKLMNGKAVEAAGGRGGAV